jgi:phosphinothricin acetyltransferase
MIRNAEHRDLPIILEIMNEAILNTTAIYDYKSRSMAFVEAWFAKKLADNLPVIVFELEGKAVGYGTFGEFRAWEAYKFSIEHSIYVHVDHQGKGIGKTLLTALIEAAKTSGYHTMIGGIDASNQKSCEFHAQFGFVEAGRIKDAGYKFDRWLDLVFMQLML